MINSQITVLKQASDYLQTISSFHYNEIIKPNFISSTGAHIRHIIDHYQAIINGINHNYIDYDQRQRNGCCETDPKIALQQINDIIHWLNTLEFSSLNNLITLSTEISITEQQTTQVTTTIARELVFAASHAVHHYAMIAQISLLQQQPLPANFGIAPATASYLRQQH